MEKIHRNKGSIFNNLSEEDLQMDQKNRLNYTSKTAEFIYLFLIHQYQSINTI